MTLIHEGPVTQARIPQPRAPTAVRRTGTGTKVGLAAAAVGLLGLGVGLGVGYAALNSEMDSLRSDVTAMEVDVGRAQSALIVSNADYSMAREHASLQPVPGYAMQREHLSLAP